MNELSPNTVFNTIDKYIISIFSIVNNSFPRHPYMFVTKNYYSKFTIMSFWSPIPKSTAANEIPKKISGYFTDTRTMCQIYSK